MVLHNPNNWHWVDKNCIAWSRDYFKEELVGTTAESDTASATVNAVSSVDGDVEVCQRKGKVISLFDLKLDLTYVGKVAEQEVSGKIHVPEVMYDTEEDEYQFQISIDQDAPEKQPVKQVVRQKLVPLLRKKLAAFGPKLIATHGGEIQHSGNEPIHWTSKVTSNSGKAGTKPSETSEKKPEYFGVSAYNTTSVSVDAGFNASPEQLYDALTSPQMVAIWSRSPPQLDARVGGNFALFGNNVSGKFTELEKGKIIKMDWRLRDWKAGHFAELTHTFTVVDGETKMTTKWTGVPVGQEEAVEANFNDYYVKPIKVSFGYGLV